MFIIKMRVIAEKTETLQGKIGIWTNYTGKGYLKVLHILTWRDDSAVESACYYYWGPEFEFQQSCLGDHNGSKGSHTLFQLLWATPHTCAYTLTQIQMQAHSNSQVNKKFKISND